MGAILALHFQPFQTTRQHRDLVFQLARLVPRGPSHFSLGAHVKLTPFQPHRRIAPMRTLKEMANEFGVSMMTLRSQIANRNGPKGVARGNDSTRNHWYDPKDMRAWWASVQNKIKV